VVFNKGSTLYLASAEAKWKINYQNLPDCVGRFDFICVIVILSKQHRKAISSARRLVMLSKIEKKEILSARAAMEKYRTSSFCWETRKIVGKALH